jgi:hypothetical protein
VPAVGRISGASATRRKHIAAGTNLRVVITDSCGRASEVFAFYNDRGECENRIEEFQNGFRADRLSCHRFLAGAHADKGNPKVLLFFLLRLFGFLPAVQKQEFLQQVTQAA